MCIKDRDRMAEIQAFVQVAESGGIGSAAERLGVAKSAVSRRLKEPEERLGVRLVTRTTRQLRLSAVPYPQLTLPTILSLSLSVAGAYVRHSRTPPLSP